MLVVALAASSVIVASGVGVGLWAASDDDGPAASRSGGTAGSPPSGESEPSPTRSYPLSQAPRTIPAVRDHSAERGPGWRPERGHRVVVGDPALADEGRLVAGELGLAYAGEKNDERAGDLRLELNKGKGANPESYTMTVRGGRVTVSAPAEAGVFYGTRTLKQQIHGAGTAPEGSCATSPPSSGAG